MVNDLSAEAFRTLRRDRRYEAIVSAGANYQYIMMNCERPPLDDVRVRRAIALAIDREEMIEALMLGLARPATGPPGPGVLGLPSPHPPPAPPPWISRGPAGF